MDNFKNLEQTIEQQIDPNGAPGSILAVNHQAILKTLLSMVGKYTGSVFTAQKNATTFPSGTFSWNGNALNKTTDFVITTSKKSADLNNIQFILETMVLGDIIQFKDYHGRAVFLIYQSHASGADGGGNPTWNITVKGLAENPNYIYQDAETSIAVLSYHKKLVDATPAISTDAGNYAIIGSDGKIYVPTPEAVAKKTIENRFVDIAKMLANQVDQTDGSIQYVNDASADPGVDSGFAYYEYLGTTNGDLTDYRRLTDVEVAEYMATEISVQNISGVEQFKVTDFIRFDGVTFDPVTKTITPMVPDAGTSSVENRYLTITELLSGQGNQTDKAIQYVGDASGDPTVDSGFAYYEKLSTSTGVLADDYRKLSESESMDIIQQVTPPNENQYNTITELTGGQANQTEKFYQLVLDASADTTVGSGWAIYQKLATTTGALTDYRKIMEQESMDVTMTGGITQQDLENYADPKTKIKVVSSSRALTDDDHNSVLMVTGTVILTIPSTGLRSNFYCDIDVIGAEKATFQGDGNGVQLDFPHGVELEGNKIATIYRKPNLNQYRGKGEFYSFQN